MFLDHEWTLEFGRSLNTAFVRCAPAFHLTGVNVLSSQTLINAFTKRW